MLQNMQQQCFVQRRNHEQIQTICPNLWQSMLVFSSHQVPHVFCTWDPWWPTHSIAKALLVRVEMRRRNRFLGKTGLCHSKGHVALFWTNPRAIYPLLFQWSCREGLPVQGRAWCKSTPALWALWYEFWIIWMKATALQAQSELLRSHGWKKVMCCWNLCWCSRGASNDSTSL